MNLIVAIYISIDLNTMRFFNSRINHKKALLAQALSKYISVYNHCESKLQMYYKIQKNYKIIPPSLQKLINKYMNYQVVCLIGYDDIIKYL